MPPSPRDKGQKQLFNKKKKSGFKRFSGWAGTQADDLVNAGTGLPTAGAQLFSAVMGNKEAQDKLFEGQVEGIKALGDKEEWRDHTVMNALTAAGIIAPMAKPLSGVSAAARAGSGSRAAAFGKGFKAAPSRKFAGVPKKAGQIPKRYDVPASNSVAIRMARKATLDPIYRASAKRATPTKKHPEGRRGGGYAKAQEQRQRDKQARFIKQSRGVPTPESKRKTKAIEQAYLAPTNLMRAALPLRPRYYMQNLPSTALMLLTQQGLGLPKSIAQAGKMKKNAPDLYKQTKNILGESGSSSVGIGAKGFLGGTAQKIAHIGNIPESHMRTAAMMKELRREGINPNDYAAVQKLYDSPESSKFQKVATRGNEAVGDYSRLSPKEIEFMSSGLPIFYSMNKALGRYAGRMPTQHPTLTALLANLGETGHEEQMDKFGGVLPPQSPYLIPSGPGKTKNPQNLLPYSPGVDLLRAGKTVVDEGVPQWNPLALVGPSPEAAFAAMSNRSLQTGWKLKDAANRSPAESAIRETLPLVPGTDIATMLGLLEARESKAYPDPTTKDQLTNWLTGRAYFDRKTNYAELRRQGKRAKKSGR